MVKLLKKILVWLNFISYLFLGVVLGAWIVRISAFLFGFMDVYIISNSMAEDWICLIAISSIILVVYGITSYIMNKYGMLSVNEKLKEFMEDKKAE